MPSRSQLPADIQPFIRKQAVEVTESRWDYDIGLLTTHLEGTFALSPARRRFLEQIPPWDYQGWQWVTDKPTESEWRPVTIGH